jgi:hypothetical protein
VPETEFTAKCDFSQHSNLDILKSSKVHEDFHHNIYQNPQKHRTKRVFARKHQTVRARPGQLSARTVFQGESVLCGGFV